MYSISHGILLSCCVYAIFTPRISRDHPQTGYGHECAHPVTFAQLQNHGHIICINVSYHYIFMEISPCACSLYCHHDIQTWPCSIFTSSFTILYRLQPKFGSQLNSSMVFSTASMIWVNYIN